MSRKLKHKNQYKPLEKISYDRIMSMILIDSTNKIRLLHDCLTEKGFDPSNMYVILDGRTNKTYQTPEPTTAQWFFNSLVRSTTKAECTENTDKTTRKIFVIY